ncbi:MAG: tetratricopeptide repeat protein, partial [Planctomycetota bacterium]|nr:tetratricopeptide repeat protein [Planctomycetota bacterium]
MAVSLGYLAEMDGDRELLPKAESWYRKAIAINPDFTMAYFNLADCLDKQGRLDAAVEAMRGTIRCEPNHVPCRAVLGELLMRAGRFEEAEKHLRLAIQLDPQN